MRDTSSRSERPAYAIGSREADQRSNGTRWRVTPQLAVGLFILGLGILLTLDVLGIVEASSVIRYWPAGLIGIGATMWASGRHGAASRFWGSVWIVLGTWFLVNTLGILRIGFWELFWPLVLVLVGLKLVLHTSRQRSKAPAETGDANLFALMGECKRASKDAPFRGGQMTAIMGGCRFDLRQATIPDGEEATIEVFALMGGLEIWVPGHWNVASDDVVPIMGGVEDKRLPPLPTAEGTGVPPRLRLRGYVGMGGLSIKN